MTLNGRKIVDAESVGSDCDAYFLKARFADTGKKLDDNELDELTNLYPEILEENARDRSIMAAEAYFEGDR